MPGLLIINKPEIHWSY